MVVKYIQTKSTALTFGISSSSTAIQLKQLLKLDGTSMSASDIGDLLYGTFAPGTSREEIFSIVGANVTVESDGKITITNVTRGLKEVSPYTTGGYSCDHPAGEIVVFGNNPQVYQWLKDYIDAAIISGSVPATDAVPGIVIQGTQTQVDAGTTQETYNAQNYDLFVRPDTLRAKKYHDYVVDAVGTDSYAITPVPAITAYAAGQEFTFKAGIANTGACTLNVNGLGAISILKNVTEELTTGDILANQIVKVVYDASNNFQVVSILGGLANTTDIQIFTTEAISYGGHTTRFDITNPSGTTFRYTYDGTGIDPTINSTTFPVGAFVEIQATGAGSSISNSNLGLFIITGSGTNYFEISNPLGIAEDNKVLDPGGFLSVCNLTWTKPDNAKIVEVITIGGGSGGGFGNVKGSTGHQFNGGAGGSGGAYARALFRASDIGATEKINVGFGGEGGNAVSNAVGEYGGTSAFGFLLRAYGGGGGEASGASSTNGSGGGGGTGGKGVRGDTTAAVNGGLPNSGTGAGIAGQGAGGSYGAIGKCAEYGGASGGAGQTTSTGFAGGSSLYGGAGGGGGGGINGATPGVPAAGAAGGVWGSYIAGGGGAGGAATGVAGTAGTSRSGYGCGDGGGGGGANNTGSSGAGGAGGLPGGGGGGGGSNAVSTTGASGGKGGRGEVRVITYF